MTDEELLTRLAETPVEEWTPDEVELLRARLPESPDLRAAMAEHLLLESVLTTALGRPKVSAEAILAQVDAERRARFVGRAIRWAAALFLLAVAGLNIWWGYRKFSHVDEPIAAKDPKSKPLWPDETEIPSPTASASATAAPPVPTPTPSATPTATASVVAPTPPGGQPEPWVAMLAKAPRSHEDLAFDDRRQSRDAAVLGRWWDTLTGQLHAAAGRDDMGLALDGLFRLRSPWPADGVLTLWLIGNGGYDARLHLWHGERGVTIEYHEKPSPHWAAYVVTKRTDQPLPASWAYAAGDDDRGRRTGYGPIELAWHDGRLYLSRGDVLLLSVPLAGVPDAVCLEAHARLKGMALARSTGLPPSWIPQPLETWTDYTADTPVLSSLPKGATFSRVGATGLILETESTDKEAWAALPLTRPGIHEVVFDVESADANTGIYLGDATGKPKSTIGVFDDYKIGVPVIGFAEPRDSSGRFRRDLKPGAEPRIGFPLKLRLLAGANFVKCSASLDGVSWGRILEVQRVDDTKLATVGVCCSPGKTGRAIRVGRISFRTLLTYDELLAGELPPSPKNYDFTAWAVQLLRGDEPDDVRFHRLAKALCQGLPGDADRIVLAELAALPCGDAPPDAPKTVERDLEYIDRLAQISDAFDTGFSQTWVDRVARSPAILANRHDAEPNDTAVHAPFSSIRKPLVNLAAGNYRGITTMPDEPIRMEIVRLMLDGDWDRLDHLCRAWHRFGGRKELTSDGRRGYSSIPRPTIMPLVDWAAALAERRRDGAEGVPSTAMQNPFLAEWRHPLIEQFGKEGYNVLAELETALDEKAYDDACRIITGVTASQAVGLLPNAHDADLLTSLPGAVALAMKANPDLRAAMQREYGDLAMLRLKQATADGDLNAIRALTTQFYGTDAAAEAHLWLGDRALSQGYVARAEGHYRTALHEGAPEAAPKIEARLRLAAAFQGRDYGEPPTTSVKLGDATLSVADFERAVSTLRGRAAAPSAGSHTTMAHYPPQVVETLPKPTPLKAKPFAVLDGDVGKAEKPPREGIDYVAQQTAFVFTDKRMIVSNRFQVAAYELTDGKRPWRTGVGNEQGRTYQWLGVPMPPVVVDSRIFVRRLLANGPELACLAATDGRVVWRSPRGDVVASDPVVRGDRVLVVTLNVPQSESLELSLTAYDANTGRLISRRPIALVRDYWKRELPCFLTAAEEMFVVSAAGCVIGCDGEGEPRWTRRLLWSPPSVDAYLGPPTWTAPLVAENRIEVAQPGVPFRYVIDVRTGSLVEKRVEVRSDRPSPGAFVALPEVQRTTTSALAGPVADSFVRKLHRARLVWTENDRIVAHAGLGPWSKQAPGLGPLTVHQGHLFAFTTDDLKKTTRQIVELVPAESDEPPHDAIRSASPILDDWRRAALGQPQWDAGRMEHEWTLLQGRYTAYGDKSFVENRLFIDNDCPVTPAVFDRPVFWTREVTLPADRPMTLHLRTAAAGETPYKVRLRVADETPFEKTYEAKKGSTPWNDERIDLTKYRGRTVRLILTGDVNGDKGKTSLIAWQRMEIQ